VGDEHSQEMSGKSQIRAVIDSVESHCETGVECIGIGDALRNNDRSATGGGNRGARFAGIRL